MTGLDQDMMQKNLTCKNLRDAQKDMCSYGLSFIPLNMLFLGMGILLLALASREGIALPVKGDDILPLFCAEGYLGNEVLVLFTIGIIAAAFSSADSALTALTTSFCVDILDVERRFARPEAVRKRVHGVIALLFVGFILCFEAVNDSSVIDAIYVVASTLTGRCWACLLSVCLPGANRGLRLSRGFVSRHPCVATCWTSGPLRSTAIVSDMSC